MSRPANLHYSADHEWLSKEEPATVGLTDYAAESLGDIVYVELPAVGTALVAGSACGEVESTKSVSDLFAPATGTVVEVNAAVVEDPSLLNQAPFENWLYRMDVSEPVEGLMSAESYSELVGE